MINPTLLLKPGYLVIAGFLSLILFIVGIARDSRGRFVKGGAESTGDFHPQWLNIPKIAETTQGTFVQSSQIMLPTQRESGIAMEIIKVKYMIGDSDTHARDEDTKQLVTAQITTKSQSAIKTSFDHELLSQKQFEKVLAFAESTETGGAGYAQDNSPEDVIAGPDGVGPLTVARSIYLGYDTTAVSGPLSTCSARILYRLVRLSKAEMLGLLEEAVS